MALDAGRRHSIVEKLDPLLGPADAHALMAEFPSDEAHRPASRLELDAGLNGLRVEMHSEFADVRGEIAGLRVEMQAEFADVRGEIAGLRQEMYGELAAVRTEVSELRQDMMVGFAELRSEMAERFRQQTMWMVATLMVAVGVATGIAQAFG